MTPSDFARQLPSPPDPMLTALEEAICGFFPSGRHSHVRAVLASYGDMATKTDALTIAKLAGIVKDARLDKAMNDKADRAIDQVIRDLTDSPVGMLNTADETASS